MTITALPTPPSRGEDPENFSVKADALLGALPVFVTEANALSADLNLLEIDVQAIKDDAVAELLVIKADAVADMTTIKVDTIAIRDDTDTIRNDAIAQTTTLKNEASDARDASVGARDASIVARDLSEDYKDMAQTAAIAAAAGAGLPSLVGKAGKQLKVVPTEDGVIWESSFTRLPIFSASAAVSNPFSSCEDMTAGCVYTTNLGLQTVGVTYSNSLFVATTGTVDSNVATSSTGKVWTLRAMPSAATWRVATNGTNSIASAEGSTSVAKSTNSTTWTAATALAGTATANTLIAENLGVWLIHNSGTTAYTSNNHGTSWVTVTLPATPGLYGGFFKVNGKFWYWTSGTTAYYSTTGATGSWSSVALPVTPGCIWQDSDANVYFMAAGVGSQLYKTTSHITFAAVTGVTARVTNQRMYLINGVFASFDITFGEGGTYHNGIFISRASPTQSVAQNRSTATNGSIWVINGAGGNVLTFSEADSPTAIFEV